MSPRNGENKEETITNLGNFPELHMEVFILNIYPYTEMITNCKTNPEIIFCKRHQFYSFK